MNFRRKLEVTPLEDRTVPATVTIESLGDATEGGSNGGFRLTRSDTSGAQFVSVSLSGTATHGSDSGNGEPFQIVVLNGQATADWTLIATNDLVGVAGVEAVEATQQAGPGQCPAQPLRDHDHVLLHPGQDPRVHRNERLAGALGE